MGKQTKIGGSNFGGQWTREKLTVIEDYLNFYVRALSKQRVKLVYIDAFAGSGTTVLQDGSTVPGSAVIALNCDFDEYYFIEIDEGRRNELTKTINEYFPEKWSKIKLIGEDCNKSLLLVLSSLSVYKRGVMFLDPYALELDWSILEAASKTHILDVWYLFPLNALVRNLRKDKKPNEATSKKIDSILGTHDWETELYKRSAQGSLFGDELYERTDFESLVAYIRKRLDETFAYVSPKSRILKNKNNSPLFILCFMMSNPSAKATGLGGTVVNQIFSKVDKMAKEPENNYEDDQPTLFTL